MALPLDATHLGPQLTDDEHQHTVEQGKLIPQGASSSMMQGRGLGTILV